MVVVVYYGGTLAVVGSLAGGFFQYQVRWVSGENLALEP